MPSLRQRQREVAEEAISAAALTLFEDRGVQATSVEDIAKAADLSERTVFRYFPRKEDTALLAHARLRRALQRAVDDTRLESAPLERIRAAYADVLARFDESDHGVLSALERVDRLKGREPLLLQAGLRVDAEQSAWLAGTLTDRAGLDPLRARLISEAVGLLFRQSMQYWADEHRHFTGLTLAASFDHVTDALTVLSGELARPRPQSSSGSRA